MNLIFYKPCGVLSQFTPDGSANTPLSAFGLPKGVYPVGRLDADSEGMLLLSDDKALPDALLNPKWGHLREYLVQVEREPSDQALEQLRRGVPIKGYQTLPAVVARVPEPDLPPRDPPIRFRKNVPTVWLSIQLREGKNRQVRRMTAAVGHPTLRLVRVAIGQLSLRQSPLATLGPGQYVELNPAQTKLLLAGHPPRKQARARRRR